MLRTEDDAGRRAAATAGLGGIAFSVFTLLAVQVSNAPGGSYSVKQVTDYLASGHRVAEIVVFHLFLLGLFGLVTLLAHLRDGLGGGRGRNVFWGAGVAATACFAAGWAIIAGQVVAHLEGGHAVAVPPAVTYLISEIGVVFVFGCGAILLGLALVVLGLSSSALLPVWLRRVTLVCGVAGIAGLAFFPFFLSMLWGLAMGGWLLAGARRSVAVGAAASVG